MKIYNFVFIVCMFIGLAGAFGVVILGSSRMTDVDVWKLRVDQLQDVNLHSGEQIQPELMMDSIDIADYFEQNQTGYRYLGGLYDGQWETGADYSFKELNLKNKTESRVPGLLTLPVGLHGLYINIDRGGEDVARQFLQVMDQHASEELDTLIIDFRFLRRVDFGSFLRLFNQFAPQERIVLGNIVNAHQEQEILSSGRPFFSVDRTVFLVNEYVPSSIKRLIMNLNQRTSYSIAGDLGKVNDTVCLFTDFVIGPETYRVCTDQLATESPEDAVSTPVDFYTDSIGMQLIREMDQLWYKEQDTTAMEKYLKVLLGQLLPQEN